MSYKKILLLAWSKTFQTMHKIAYWTQSRLHLWNNQFQMQNGMYSDKWSSQRLSLVPLTERQSTRNLPQMLKLWGSKAGAQILFTKNRNNQVTKGAYISHVKLNLCCALQYSTVLWWAHYFSFWSIMMYVL